jgi:RHS repeat-associated protein
VAAVADASGAALMRNTYDEFGQRGAANLGRFQFTGQMWLSEANVYHYRARAYSPTLGRFLQTDPISHSGGMNLYACVGNVDANDRCRRNRAGREYAKRLTAIERVGRS